ncbi:MAG: DNA polymerase III subunit alpha [Moraxella sp.]|nr:DNA polymerase III subunit alpha [Moraxella sp.]
MSFTHLAVRTEYAIVDSIVRIKPMVARAAELGMTSLGIADMSNLFAAVKFYKACVGAGIKPVIGVEVVMGEVADGTAKDNQHSVILYAMDNDGYHNLLKLVSNSYTDGLVDGVPIVTYADLFTHSAGVIAILTERSEINAPLKGNNPERVQSIFAKWHEVFGDRLYIGVKRTGRAGEDMFIRNAAAQAQKLAIPLVAYNDVRFLASDDFDAHEARVCIAGKYVLADKNRPHNYHESQYFKSNDEMAHAFDDIPIVLDNANALASRCNVSLRLGENFLPDFPVPAGMTIDDYLRQVSLDGLEARLDKLYPVDKRDDTWQAIKQPYLDRLGYELDIIIGMGFPGYFLIVMDFIRWAKENDVPVGPGRGSGAGSLVAYALNITDLDPLHYELLFERFLNPERVSMPDFDVDFCIDGRDRVIDYVAQTYGRDAVSQIITFGTMAAKAVVRDVARVQGKSYAVGDKISKLIPATPGISLAEAVEEEPQLKDLLTNPDTFDHEDAVEVWEMAIKLEGITRNVGKHAGGVLIAPGRISDFSAVYCDSDGHRVSQFDKDDVEAVGLVKFDFLGLRNLTVIKAAIDNINARLSREKLPPIDLDELPLDDKNVYQTLLQEGNTTAVFQLESSGMKKYLKKLKPSNIEDVIAMCALYRPGPLETGMVEMYIDRKHGIQEVIYDHDLLEPILSNTYGVIVYQEQVMQISQSMAGYSLGGADMLRRAMGKKKPEEMAKQRDIFAEGAKGLNIDPVIATNVFDLMEKFAGYGFNKSHSAAYGVLAYQTAYLKHYYPAEFMAAVLTSEMNNTDSVVFLISDCKDNFGLQVLPPSVNHSQWHFVAKTPKIIVSGLGAVKGVGEAAVESIVDARKDGEFKDLYDFCNRVDIKKVGKRALEALVRAGCFDDLASSLRPDLLDVDGQNLSYEIRGGLWEQLPTAMRAAEQNRENSMVGTLDLFASVDTALSVAPPLPDIIWSVKERLKGENDTLGLYLTGHPIDEYRNELKHYVRVPQLSELGDTGFKGSTWFAGLIIDVANFGNRVAVTIDDGTSRLEISVYSDKFAKLKDILKIGEIIIIKASVRESDGRLFVRILHAMNITSARAKFLKHVNIKLDSNNANAMQSIFALLKEKITPTLPAIAEDSDEDTDSYGMQTQTLNDGCVPIHLYIHDDFGIARVHVNDRFRITPTDDVIHSLHSILPADNIKLEFA